MNTINVKNQPVELNASTVLMVSNISRNVSKKHIYEIFSQYGELKGVYVPRNEETKVQKPYVFLEYANQENAEKAMLYFSGGQIDGIIVKVEILNPDNLINNSINANVNTLNKSKEENVITSNRSYRDKTRENINFPENENKNEIADDINNIDDNNLNNIDAKKNMPPSADNNFNKSQVKRIRSRSHSRKRSRSNSYPRYKRDNNYKNNQNYTNNYYPYGGSRRNQDYNRRKFRKRNSKSSGKSSDRSSSRSSKSSS